MFVKREKFLPPVLIKKIGVYTVGIIIFSGISAVSAGEIRERYSKRNLFISQEKYESNGLLISRPSSLDERVRDFIIFKNINSLQDYVQWLAKNVQYRKERIDSWSSPQDTLKKKYGDCEDFAFLNAAFLRVLGYKPKVVGVVRRFGRNHAICVFKDNGYYLWFDNAKLKRTPAKSILEFAQYIFTKYNISALRELKFKARSEDILFRRADILSRKQ
jgi:hypothetical protein